MPRKILPKNFADSVDTKSDGVPYWYHTEGDSLPDTGHKGVIMARNANGTAGVSQRTYSRTAYGSQRMMGQFDSGTVFRTGSAPVSTAAVLSANFASLEVAEGRSRCAVPAARAALLAAARYFERGTGTMADDWADDLKALALSPADLAALADRTDYANARTIYKALKGGAPLEWATAFVS